MDYAEMVSQIMAAEQGAKVLAEESRARRQQLQVPGAGDLRYARELSGAGPAAAGAGAAD
ncbi:hypothetical protein M5E87_14370 [Flavonifractor plautii]|nr:hypothetical protein M5E87_14370 [Flavonifractor plautii]